MLYLIRLIIPFKYNKIRPNIGIVEYIAGQFLKRTQSTKPYATPQIWLQDRVSSSFQQYFLQSCLFVHLFGMFYSIFRISIL